jgi:hypothetical protein
MAMGMLSAEDRLELFDLSARYYTTIDEKDADGFMRCWVDNDEILYESAEGNVKGRQGMRAFFDHHVHQGMGVGKRHVVGNVTINEGEDNNTAYTTSYMIVLAVDEIPHIFATAILRNSKVIRTAAGWQFQHRTTVTDPGLQKLLEQGQQMSDQP